MTEDQKTIVKTTWAAVEEIADTAAALFYAKLFELDPALRPMFSNSDMKEQGRKLMTMIGIAVKGIDNLEALLPAVRSLGQRHVGYGVQPHHYGTVGAALIDTLAKGLGDAFTPAAAHAWTITYTTLADAMRDASYGPSAPLAQAG